MEFPNLKTCKKLKAFGFPQEPKEIIAGGIDGEIKGGFYFTCRVEGECGFSLLTEKEYQETIKAENPKYYLIKIPSLNEIIRETTNYIIDNIGFSRKFPNGMPCFNLFIEGHQMEKSPQWWWVGNMIREQANKEMGETCDWAEGGSIEEALINLYFKFHETI